MPKGSVAGTLLLLGASACFDRPLLGSDAQVRFVNAAPVPITVLRNSAAVAGNIAYANSSGCIGVTPSSHGLAVQFQNGPTLSVMQGLHSGERATIVATRHGSATQTIVQFISLFSTFTPPAGHGGLRVVNASGAGPFDVFVTPQDAPQGSAQAVDLGSGQQTVFIGIPEGPRQIRLAVSGTQSVSVDAGTHSFVAGQNVTLVVAPGQTSGSAPRTFFVPSGDCE
jgi:hypothetical protein